MLKTSATTRKTSDTLFEDATKILVLAEKVTTPPTDQKDEWADFADMFLCAAARVMIQYNQETGEAYDRQLLHNRLNHWLDSITADEPVLN